ncbi:SDR family NAD(P)-dependent oxidoreductase [Nocardia sp. NPDC004750]
MNDRLSGKRAVVTGGTRGLGRAIADAFAAEGAHVVCAGRTDPAGHPDWPREFTYLPVDVTDADSVEEMMSRAADTLGGIDIVVANAGVSIDGRVHRTTAADWATTMAVNVNGVFHTTRSAIPHLEKTGGTIINVSSSMATRVAVGAAAYCASKAAVEMFTKVSAAELGSRNITVNCLAPGILDGGIADELAQNPKAWELYRDRLIAKRVGRVAEAAAGAVFLASGDSSYVNGHVLEVNGGLLWA